ncbi:hypothetical protein HU200_036153 [Digitaria exilis]|uniref:Uncharacterized protein n=1 Tax=Digitaria exilis TaxID=1010633 RepID=A0A835EL68_9POAL|nr:hypothetical protein HU200_036153 [Digitaria exilis]
MALKTVILAILLLLSLVSADLVQIQQVGGTEVQELVENRSSDGDGGNGVTPKSTCVEKQLYIGPCVEIFCAGACLVQLKQGGHCKGHFWWGKCICFVCS